jgi:glyoxylase-like metal-dependent hydrolase (beta-lactamase superfamily II)
MADQTASLPPTMHVMERGWLSSNNIVFIGRDRTVLVDSGYVSHAEQTVMLVEHALRQRPLDVLLNTHLHSDHCGGNAALQQRYACHTLVPASQADAVRSWDTAVLGFADIGQQCKRFTTDAAITPGETIEMGDLQWQILGAPGHDPHSVILYCAEERLLISADALWQNGFGVIFPELEGDSGFAETRDTLNLIAALDIRLVIPGHGAPFADVGPALDRAFSRIDYLQADPLRNAQNAIKVLLKFILLERQQIAFQTVPTVLNSIRIVTEINRRFFGLSADALATWAIQQLLKAGAARLTDDALCNVG